MKEPETDRASGREPGEAIESAARGDGGTEPQTCDPVPVEVPCEDVQAGAIQRLHFATVWIPVLDTILRSAVPVAILGTLFGYRNVVLFAVAFLLVPSALGGLVRVLTVRYQIRGTELIIRSGLISRRERRISFDRIQDTEIQQGIFHRIFNVAQLEITTAGAETQEAVLDSLSTTAAETLRDAVAVYQKGPAVAEGTDATGPAEVPRCLCQLSLPDLVMGGLTSNLVASIMAIIGTVLYFRLFLDIGVPDFGIPDFGEVDQRVADGIDQVLPEGDLFEWGSDFFFRETLGKSVLFAFGGFFVSIVSYVTRYHGFQLTRTGDVLSKGHGLFRVRKSNLGRNHVQALKVEEGFLRRWFALAAVRVDSAGDRNQVEENSKRDVLVPVISRTALDGLIREVIPDLATPEPAWKKISPLAVMRGSKKGWLLVLAVMGQTYLVFGWLCLSWLPAFPFVYLLNYQWYRNTGYFVEEKYLMSRKGWLNRETLFLPVRNIQNVSVTQNYFDRRLDLATLSVDTAGQSNTGGGPVIRHLPVDEARGIQQLLARRVAARAFVW